MLNQFYLKKVGSIEKERTDNEVKKFIEELTNNLNLPKQNNIKKALEDYEKRLLETRARINAIKDEIKQEENKLPKDKKTIDTQESLEIKEKIQALKVVQKRAFKRVRNSLLFFYKRWQEANNKKFEIKNKLYNQSW